MPLIKILKEKKTFIFRSSRPQLFYKKNCSIRKVFAKVYLQPIKETQTRVYFYEFSKFLKKPILQNTCKYLVLDFEQFSLLYVSLQCIQQDFNIGELSPKVIIRFQNPTFYYIFSRETRLRIEIEHFDSFTSKYIYGYSWLFIVSSIFSYNRKISLLFFFLFPWKCFESTCFLKQCNRIRDSSPQEDYFSPSVIWPSLNT